jgi:hypothetical protein
VLHGQEISAHREKIVIPGKTICPGIAIGRAYVLRSRIKVSRSKVPEDSVGGEMKKSLEHFIHCKNDNNTIGMIEYDSGFHNLISQTTKNSTLSVSMETITNSLLCGWKAILHIPSRVEKTVQEHAEILYAIENRLAEKASQTMKSHLEHALNDLSKYGLVDKDTKRTQQQTMYKTSS